MIEKNIRKGLVTEFFVRKGQELIRSWTALDRFSPRKTHRPKVLHADALRLPQTIAGEFQADLILCSPPYGGTYDYYEHHALRYAWLSLNANRLKKDELGARRQFSKVGGKEGLREWDKQVREFLGAMESLLLPEGVALFLMGDGEIGGKRVAADQQFERLGAEVGLDFMAAASQDRPDWQGKSERQEHLIALMRSPNPKKQRRRKP